MSAAKSERVLNLLIALLTTKRFLTKAELREMVEGYGKTASFDRTFERDKAELRDLGITIETGSNDPDVDDEDGYRIDRNDFELPEIEFTREELVAIGLASHAWQSSVGASATTSALQRLRAAGAAPDLDRLPQIRAQIPVVETCFDTIYQALVERRTVQFDYDGKRRRLQPWGLHQRRGLWLVHGFDLDREAPRRFKLSRIDGKVTAVGAADSYMVPDDVDALLSPATTEASAIVAIRDVPELLRGARRVDWHEPLPDGFAAHEIQRYAEAMIVDDVCVAGPDAILLEPEHLRQAVIERLTRMAGGAA